METNLINNRNINIVLPVVLTRLHWTRQDISNIKLQVTGIIIVSEKYKLVKPNSRITCFQE